MPWLVPCLSEVSTSNPLTPSSKPPARSSPATSPGCPMGKPAIGWNGIAALELKIAATDGLERTPQTWRETETRHSFSRSPRTRRPRGGHHLRQPRLRRRRDRLACAFAAAVDRGTLADDMRFQVGLVTAYMALMAYIELEHRDALTPAYERALGREVSRIVDSIPAHRLAIQWDCPCEVGITEQVGPPNTWTLDDVAAELGRMAALLPAEVELDYRHRYGDPPDEASGHGKHWMEPNDASAMVRLTNAMLDHITRPVGWVHMPVPIGGGFVHAYFEPLADLGLPEDTELYLGLVHFEDGVAGTQSRIETASGYVAGFGVASKTETEPSSTHNNARHRIAGDAEAGHVARCRLDPALSSGDAVLKVDQAEIELGVLGQTQVGERLKVGVVGAPDGHRHVHPADGSRDVVEHGIVRRTIALASLGSIQCLPCPLASSGGSP